MLQCIPCEALGSETGRKEMGGRGGSWEGGNTSPIMRRDGEAVVLTTSQHRFCAEHVPVRHPELRLCHAAGLRASGKALRAPFHGCALLDADAAWLSLSLAQPGLHRQRQPVSTARVCGRGDGIAILLGSVLLCISCIIAGNTSGL